ncbi:hypothetical protein [Polyangium fumosum]|uniref:Uncharacterized protein n=1 Tax=Polyangium fumosum TaxID=889272 RepID=A0A4U1IW06_9BACT|nr:hypothetical protein [Polyangium fumosum]TKC98590.1 hypothetical protein E8A74_40690 [Polyangium fumosum]
MSEPVQDLTDLDEAPFGLEYGPAVREAPEYFWTSYLGTLVRYRDDEARPLGEGTAPRRYLEGVPMEMRTCPYAGSRNRHPLPMNVSALRQVTQHWSEVAGGMALLRELYVKHRERGRAEAPLSLTDVWKVSRLGLMLPAYLLRRAHHPLADGEIPAMAAVIYKIMLGLNRVADNQALMAFAAGVYDSVSPLDPATLFAFSEGNDLFIGRHSVCAGTPAMVEETFRIILYGHCTSDYDTALMARLLEPGALEYFNLLMAMDIHKYDFGLRSTLQSYDLARLVDAPGWQDMGALAQAAIDFDQRTMQTSSLAREVAYAGSQARQRVLEGLRQFRDELEEERLSMGAEGFAWAYARAESLAVPPPGHAEALVAFLGRFRQDSPTLRAFADALADYFALERASLWLFETMQHRIDLALGHTPTPLQLVGVDVPKIFGPKLRDLAAELFGLQIEVTSQETLLRKDGHELSLRF